MENKEVFNEILNIVENIFDEIEKDRFTLKSKVCNPYLYAEDYVLKIKKSICNLRDNKT